MNSTIDRNEWPLFLKDYSERNEGRATRLGLFESRGDSMTDYWIEDGLPLLGLDVYLNGERTRIDILLKNYTHTIDAPVRIAAIGSDGLDGLDISDDEGSTTLLRFENWPTHIGEE